MTSPNKRKTNCFNWLKTSSPRRVPLSHNHTVQMGIIQQVDISCGIFECSSIDHSLSQYGLFDPVVHLFQCLFKIYMVSHGWLDFDTIKSRTFRAMPWLCANWYQFRSPTRRLGTYSIMQFWNATAKLHKSAKNGRYPPTQNGNSIHFSYSLAHTLLLIGSHREEVPEVPTVPSFFWGRKIPTCDSEFCEGTLGTCLVLI